MCRVLMIVLMIERHAQGKVLTHDSSNMIHFNKMVPE